MRGRKPIPEEIRAARGTLQKCRTNPARPKGTAGAPDRPRGLDAREARAWAEITADLAALGVLVEEHRVAVETYVCAVVRYRRARESMRRVGTVDTSGRRTGAARELDAAFAAMRAMAAEFGATPSSASRVRAAPAVKDDAATARRKRFAALGARQTS